MENITEETIGHSSSSSDDDDDDEDDDDDIESPEFIPSAWDKYATPTKSALRSPEKTLEKTEKVDYFSIFGIITKKYFSEKIQRCVVQETEISLRL